ncbi:unnamed protein product [Adineta steineri]|uniref:BHLH domain-containing protein n=2 Tax=Adineta steineri TaxID=433720 RepID=A0A814DEQ6_9BILA|nr:unnamed protein product [Adineta steineri]CAF1106173.1 unnamed protein product [Adineta steineri]
MFTSSDTNLPDLDFEFIDELQQNQPFNGGMIKELLSTSSPASTYRIVKPINNNKRGGAIQLRRQLTDDSTGKPRTPPNSTGTSLSPLSTSYISRLSSNDNSPIRTANTMRMSSPATNNINNNGLSSSAKQVDAVTLLLKQTIAPAQLIQSVQTRLENPTRYHLEQMCRRQTLVADDLSSTHTNMLPQSHQQQQEESSPDSEITSEMDDQLNDDTTCGSIDSASHGISISQRLSTPITGDHAGSVYLSSSISKDSNDSINHHSSSCPTNILSAKAKIGLPLTDDEMRLVIRDRQKKDNHNMIERRRRFNINDRIKELGTLLPKGTDLDLKQNKGTILRASVDYIKILRRQYDNISLVEEKCQLLNEHNLQLLERVRELEKKCLINGIPVNSPRKSSSAISVTQSNMIKEEPSSVSSSFNNATNPIVPPSTPIYATFDSYPPLDSLSVFRLVDDDSNDKISVSGNTNNNNIDPLSPLGGHDPFLSSVSFGYDNEMDIGGIFP